MTQSKARIATSTYIGPERQLCGGRPYTSEEAAIVVVHELYTLWGVFRQTKLRADLLTFINRAVYLQRLGFELILNKRQDCVCARRKGVRAWETTSYVH
jgi:hypothetical protein